MTENATNQELSPRQKLAINMLLSGKTPAEVCTDLGISGATFYRWMGKPIFRQALTSEENKVIDAATRRLINLAEKAIDTLQDVMVNGGGERYRLTAATAILDRLMTLRDLRNTEERLAALESEVFSESK